MPPSKTLPQVLVIIQTGDGNCLFFPNSIFGMYFFLRRKGGEDYAVEKDTKINKGVNYKFL